MTHFLSTSWCRHCTANISHSSSVQNNLLWSYVIHKWIMLTPSWNQKQTKGMAHKIKFIMNSMYFLHVNKLALNIFPSISSLGISPHFLPSTPCQVPLAPPSLRHSLNFYLWSPTSSFLATHKGVKLKSRRLYKDYLQIKILNNNRNLYINVK